MPSAPRELQFGGGQFSPPVIDLPDKGGQPSFPGSASGGGGRFSGGGFHAAMPVFAPRDSFSKLLGSGKIPLVAHGKSYGPTAGSWYRVAFERPIKNATPLALTHYRAAQFVKRSVSNVASLSSRTVQHITLPTVTRDDFRYKGYNAVNDAIKEKMGDWGWANWIRDAVAGTAAWVGWFLGAVMNFLWDTFIGPRFDDFNSKINQVQDAINTQLIDQFNNLIGTMNGRIKDVNDALAKQIDDLYTGIGLPNGIAITLVQVAQVSDTGFSWLSQGDQTIFWVAIGE